MSEDIHKWTDGRYALMFDEHTFFVFDNEKEKEMTALRVTEKLNEQQSIIYEQKIAIDELITDYKKLEKENEQLRKKLECCEYEHFLNELDEIHEKVDKGDLSDFSPLKEYKPLKEDLYYWQCKYYKRDYEHKMDMCARCNYGGLLNYCLKDKCDKMVKKDYEVTITGFENGMSIGWKKRS